MKFSDQGIIISIKKYGENSLLVKVFSSEHGIFSGFVKSAKSSKDKVIFQIGNLISFEYRARVEENLGQFFYVDLIKSFLSKIIFDKLKIDCVNSLFSIINASFLEREKQEKLFEKLRLFLQKITLDETAVEEILSDYIKLELKILKTLGYGISLNSCIVTNSTTNLAFVSPKSAHAVCLEIGQPYVDKLLRLPAFLTSEEEKYSQNCLYDGLRLTGFFLEKFLFMEKKNDGAFYRNNILKALQRLEK